MNFEIEGRVALVTGAGGGIGAGIAAALCSEGVRVAVVDIDLAAAERQASSLSARGATAMALHIDVTQKPVVNAAVARIASEWGGVDIVVNNAGFTRDKRIGRMEEAEWDSVCDVILKGAFFCTKAVVPGMIDRGWGRIINIASRAYLGNPGQANYSAAKAGLIGFTRAMSLENAKYGITANAVAPGLIDTPAVRGLRHFESVKANAEKTLPVPRLGRVEDVAATVAFLASEAAGYITGDVVHVTGGRY